MYNGFVESQERIDARLAKINAVGDVQKMREMVQADKKLAAEAASAPDEKTLRELVEEMKARLENIPAPRRQSWIENHPYIVAGSVAGAIMAIVRVLL